MYAILSRMLSTLGGRPISLWKEQKDRHRKITEKVKDAPRKMRSEGEGARAKESKRASVRVQERANIFPTGPARVLAEFGQFKTRLCRVLLYLYDLALLHAGTAAVVQNCPKVSRKVVKGQE